MFKMELARQKAGPSSQLAPKRDYAIRIIRTSLIPVQERNALITRCHQIAIAANFGVNGEDIASHLFGGDFEVALLEKENELQGFAVFDKFIIEGKKILFLHGIVLHPNAQGKRLAQELIKRKIRESDSDFLALRTHNPQMYMTAASIAANPNFVYPNFRERVPGDILELARQIKYFYNEGRPCDENLVIQGAYPQDMTQQFLQRAPLINFTFKEGILGRFDARGIIIRLK